MSEPVKGAWPYDPDQPKRRQPTNPPSHPKAGKFQIAVLVIVVMVVVSMFLPKDKNAESGLCRADKNLRDSITSQGGTYSSAAQLALEKACAP